MTEALARILPNGLAVVAERMPSLASAAFTLVIPRGSMHDPDGRSGLSAVLTEMLHRGAGDRDARALVEALDTLGLERSAANSAESITLGGALLGRDLYRALEIYREMVTAPRLDGDELEPSLMICRQAVLAVEDHPPEKMFVELYRRYLPDPVGRPAKGTIEGLDAVTLDDLRLAAAALAPRGSVLALAGDIEPQEAVVRAEEIFGSWRDAGETPRTVLTPGPGGVAHVEKETGAQVQVGLAAPYVPMTDPDYPKAVLALTVLSGGMSGRLFVEVREKLGLVYAVNASYMLLRGGGDILVYAGTTPGHCSTCVDVIRRELARMAEGVTAEELDRARVRVRGSLIMSGESSSARSSLMASDWVRLGRARTVEEILAAIEGVDLAAFNGFLARVPIVPTATVTLGPRWQGTAA